MNNSISRELRIGIFSDGVNKFLKLSFSSNIAKISLFVKLSIFIRVNER